MMGNFDLSMKDISQTLQLEPRHFGALDGMSLIFIHTNQPEKAIEIYDKMLQIFPYSIGTKLKKEKMLSLSTITGILFVGEIFENSGENCSFLSKLMSMGL